MVTFTLVPFRLSDNPRECTCVMYSRRRDISSEKENLTKIMSIKTRHFNVTFKCNSAICINFFLQTYLLLYFLNLDFCVRVLSSVDKYETVSKLIRKIFYN